MNNYNDVYYLLKGVPFQEKFLELKASKNTGRRNHTFEKLDYGDGPAFFDNAYKGEVPFHLSDAQLDGIYPVVSEKIASVIKHFNIDGFQLFPAVIVDDDGEWHEEFYFFNFYRSLDCVDFQNSVVRNYSPAKRNNTVLQYQLDENVLDAIPEENRLMIKLAGVTGGGITVP
ncbi:hypothetical protein L1D15_13300 [Vibrio sp. Isolate25]|uniref:imm11 family protein n=1 Tax=Vibrio sp. Isolate25 TaxID=2908535 RepID=UPI001EFE8474|nr:DUF1629 domain-containing protein [Vibrio sp. Isolate25]MCG9597696.1 hypothetical protein [Vibrio sp. Isolate25]